MTPDRILPCHSLRVSASPRESDLLARRRGDADDGARADGAELAFAAPHAFR